MDHLSKYSVGNFIASLNTIYTKIPYIISNKYSPTFLKDEYYHLCVVFFNQYTIIVYPLSAESAGTIGFITLHHKLKYSCKLGCRSVGVKYFHLVSKIILQTNTILFCTQSFSSIIIDWFLKFLRHTRKWQIIFFFSSKHIFQCCVFFCNCRRNSLFFRSLSRRNFDFAKKKNCHNQLIRRKALIKIADHSRASIGNKRLALQTLRL